MGWIHHGMVRGVEAGERVLTSESLVSERTADSAAVTLSSIVNAKPLMVEIYDVGVGCLAGLLILLSLEGRSGLEPVCSSPLITGLRTHFVHFLTRSPVRGILITSFARGERGLKIALVLRVSLDSFHR